ncbi:unnamed protein product [Lactuca saligna]|uniref:Uncharacterized protein n=1 Tax=Lactuca saligna TaxID=75948 RepID=A0AA35V6S7_LACSI|nr:unnamed protein product [Lactuca saligna]
MEHDLHGVEAMRAELIQLHADIKELTSTRQKLTSQVQGTTQDLARATTDLSMSQKGNAENYKHGQAMEKNLLSMACELEKLRAEMANAEKQARAAVAVTAANQNPGYNPNYVNAEANYLGNPYPTSYGISSMNKMNLVQSVAEGYPQYGPMP